MDEKLHKTSYAGFSIVSVAPSRPNQIDLGVVGKIKTLQVSESSGGQGISIEGMVKAGKSLHGSSLLSAYALKYFEKSRLALGRFPTENDSRPPLIKFSAVKELKTQHNDNLSYRMFQCDIKLVKTVLENSGFLATEGHDWNLLWIGHNPKPNFYEKLSTYQKISHFPNSYEITRKDCLCSAIMRMQEIYGKDVFGFTPETYNLPDNFSLLYNNFYKEKRPVWIVKPTCSSQGKGIYLIDNVDEIPTDETCIVSRYISNPLLINSLKFDLRIYVLVSSYEPLRVYIYEEGLARFASETYKAGHKSNRFMHLTNYSLNKKSENFVQNEDFRLDDTGHKWSLSAIIKLLEANGLSTDFLMKNIYELIIKTILSRENAIIETVHKLGLHRTNCFDLLGFDVLIDNNLKPWLLEVNLSPSMATDSSLDSYIKTNLLADMFNLIGLRAYDKKKDVYGRNRSFAKNQKKNKRDARSQSPPRGRKDASKKFQEILKETLEEQERRGHFIRIYPSKGTSYFDQFFSSPRQINMYLYKALYIDMMQENDVFYNNKPNMATFSAGLKQEFRYFKTRPGTCNIDSEILCPPICQIKPHPQRPVSIDNLNNGLDIKTEDFNGKCKNCKDSQFLCLFCRLIKISKEEKCVITNDDLLMEYLTRLVQVFEKNKDKDSLKKSVWKFKFNSFIPHSGWVCSDVEQKICKKVKNKLEEMKERRRKLASVLKRKKVLLEDMEKEDAVSGVLRKFTSCELEEMLKISSKNAVLEILKY